MGHDDHGHGIKANHVGCVAERELPPARVVRQGGVAPAFRTPWPVLGLPRRAHQAARRAYTPVQPAMRSMMVFLVGFFPLWAALVLLTLFLWFAGMRGSP